VGYLSNGAHVSMFARPLAEHGFVEGRNLRFEMRVAPAGKGPSLEGLAAELVALRPDVLVAFGASNVEALARATRTVPIVCGGTADPVGLGYAQSLRRPGGNITGLSYGVPEMAGILVGMVQAVKPGLRRIVAIVGGGEGAEQAWRRIVGSFERAVAAAGLRLDLDPVETLAGLEAGLERLDPRRDVAYFLNAPEDTLFGAAASACIRRRLASFTSIAALARAGVLLHYSIDHAEPIRKVAAIVARLLRGASAAQTPFELPDRTSFIVNRATARAIGIELPPEILARATEIVDRAPGA
jgi:putative ABC transport system substrate-binding protein